MNFDSFLPLFGKNGIKVPVAVITDADPEKVLTPGGKPTAHFPALGEAITPSANALAMKALEDDFVKVFHGVKTFEYDFALHEKNRAAMIAALKDIHPQIGAALEVTVAGAAGDSAKAQALFKGMFERSEGNVQKGRFARALAARIEGKHPLWTAGVPGCAWSANHPCERQASPGQRDRQR